MGYIQKLTVLVNGILVGTHSTMGYFLFNAMQSFKAVWLLVFVEDFCTVFHRLVFVVFLLKRTKTCSHGRIPGMQPGNRRAGMSVCITQVRAMISVTYYTPASFHNQL